LTKFAELTPPRHQSFFVYSQLHLRPTILE
jgi:hypothetical protein